MKKVSCFLAAIILFSAGALAETKEASQPEQPRLIDPEIRINLNEKTMEISFRYEEVAGHIDDARKMIVVGIAPASGGIKLSLISLRVTDSRSKKGDEIASDVMTQGQVKYYAIMPDSLVIAGPEEIVIIGIAIIDGRGRQGESVFIQKYLEEKKKPEKIGI